MKTIALVLVLFALTSVAWADSFSAKKYTWVEHECSICAKTIYEKQEYSDSSYYFLSGDIMVMPDFNNYPRREEVNYLRLPGAIVVCNDCRIKYQESLSNLLKLTMDGWLAERVKENQKLRVENLERRRVAKIEEVRKKVEGLENELKVMKEQIKGGTK